MRPSAKSSTKVLDLNREDEGVGVLDNLLEALHSGSALQPATSVLWREGVRGLFFRKI